MTVTQYSIEFQFQGTAREALAEELGHLLVDNFADWTQSKAAKPPVSRGDDKSDPVAITALIIAVPATVLATWDLAKRMQLKEKVDRLITWAQETFKKEPQSGTTIHLSDGSVVPLEQMKPEQFLDMLAEWAKKNRS